MDDIYEFYSEKNTVILEFFSAVKCGGKFSFSNTRINPKQYKKALSEFVKYGQIMRFPEKIILEWADSVIYGTILLDAITDICGHSPNFPFEEFDDAFFYN